MRVRATAALAALLLTALTACGGSDDKADSKSPDKASVDSGASSSAAEQPSKDTPFGKPAQTTGSGGTGVVEITPTNIVYTVKGGGETSQYGTFVVVTTKDKAVTAVAADEEPPAGGGGWEWIAPDGQSIDEGGGNAYNVVMDQYNNAGNIEPGSFQLRAKVFDLTAAQAEGGTLVYKDGTGVAHRWTAPAKGAGPDVAAVKKQLEF